jgi:anthraniloyl-CoA monooxygenase
LFESFTKTKTVSEALEDFELTRRQVIEEYQAAAYDSMIWFENAKNYMNLSPLELAHVLMTRSGRVSDEDLRVRDPEFMERYDATKVEGAKR